MNDASYIVCGCKSWNKDVFDAQLAVLPGTWQYIGQKEDLTLHALEEIQPRYVFFLHWSWIVPTEILDVFECINFHMTDLPYGRGGSPLQNLIVRGYTDTQLSAFRMTDELDAGPIYLKEQMSLEGTAAEILERSSVLAVEMIQKIVDQQPTPTEQEGEVVIFNRRTPDESQIPSGLSLEQMYDYIRMLDAEGYPHAYIEQNGFRYDFSDARVYDDSIDARVRISPLSES